MDEILLIDDDVELCSMLTEYMGRYGFRITAAHRGDTGLKAALEKPFALVLLDVMLPGLDGFEVLKRPVSCWPGCAPFCAERPLPRKRWKKPLCALARWN